LASGCDSKSTEAFSVLLAVDATRALNPGIDMETFLQSAEMNFFCEARREKNDAAAIHQETRRSVCAATSNKPGTLENTAQLRRSLSLNSNWLIG
jgi:hypothetical protein